MLFVIMAAVAIPQSGGAREQRNEPLKDVLKTAFRVRNEGGTLVSELHIAMLDANGHVRVPPDVREAIVEVGCSDRDTVDDELDSKYRDAFLLSFEPLMDKYAVLAARGAKRVGVRADRGIPLGHHHRRGVVLPLAVSAEGGEATIKVHRWAGCSSLRELNKDANHTRLCQEGEVERRRVPSITLEHALSLIPPQLPIKFLKLDAQGLDFDLLKAVPPHYLHRRVQYIELETISAKCDPIYIGQARCDEAGSYMRRIGYQTRNGTRDDCALNRINPYSNRKSNFGWGCEIGMHLERTRRPPMV